MTTTDAAYDDRLAEFVGRELVRRTVAKDAVSTAAIRTWAEAMEDTNPVLVDDAAARATGRDGVVAPATMLQAWTMRGYAATQALARGEATPGAEGFAELVALLDEGGYTSVVATDSDFEFAREVVPGDLISVEEVVEAISPEKRTGLGVGRFVTTLRTYRDAADEVVGTQRWRTLRFRPKPGSTADGAEPAPVETPEPPALRPRPAINLDNAFWFEAATEKRLVVQRCTTCSTLRHPPGPACPACGSFDWDTVPAGEKGTVHSYVVAHHPRHPAFDYPLLIALVDLPGPGGSPGTRLTTNLVDVRPEDVEIGMPVVLDWLEADDELTLPVFRPDPEGQR
ncbi:bifunctional MaoC family dehydratase N-terminal/OB-fold nucleic acid binding domain-containing protein [Nocardioides jensenii]|uniref:bifunctional MaoC family dehydratase N-terminal/OB-fold nucleic acid binding domain-containing protein n=1 Tax=Nocardioides jensenii TaxID=1843 RepID=UPI00082BB023|nr:MaoC family dehydratase N-terminal domain-containing protein [Nocardioides jensenii]